jgi:hypothetical protein
MPPPLFRYHPLMRLDYEMTYDDYIEASRACQRIQRTRLSVPRAIGYTGFAIGFVLFIARPDRGGALAPCFLMAISLYYLLYPYVVSDSAHRTAWAEFSRSMQPLTVEASKEGIRTTTPLEQGEYRWEAFDRYLETRNLFVLCRNPRSALTIPKRAFSTNEQLRQFRDLLTAKLDRPRGAFPVVKP